MKQTLEDLRVRYALYKAPKHTLRTKVQMKGGARAATVTQ
jgi:hypothetical protein